MYELNGVSFLVDNIEERFISVIYPERPDYVGFIDLFGNSVSVYLRPNTGDVPEAYKKWDDVTPKKFRDAGMNYLSFLDKLNLLCLDLLDRDTILFAMANEFRQILKQLPEKTDP